MRYRLRKSDELNRRVEVKRASSSRDSLGGLVQSLSTISTRWADIREKMVNYNGDNGIEFLKAFEVYMRNGDVSMGDILTFDNRNHVITQIEDIDKHSIKCLCESRD